MEPTLMVRSQFSSLICAEPQSGKESMPTLKSRKMVEKSANSRYGLKWTDRSHIRKQNVLANGATKAAATAIDWLSCQINDSHNSYNIGNSYNINTTSEAVKALVGPVATLMRAKSAIFSAKAATTAAVTILAIVFTKTIAAAIASLAQLPHERQPPQLPS